MPAPDRRSEASSLEVISAYLIRAWYLAARSAESKTRVEELLDWLEGNGYGDSPYLRSRPLKNSTAWFKKQ